jgi:hypothetical protein
MIRYRGAASAHRARARTLDSTPSLAALELLMFAELQPPGPLNSKT